jgi:alanyl-tRNA synthetase
MEPNPRGDSALHVLKGAVQKTLNATLTTSVYMKGDRGALTVEYSGDISEDQLKRIEQLANEKIREDVPIEMFEMDRGEAEERFGDIIYDKFPVPSHIDRLAITRIEDWNINCCLGPHVKRTGEVGRIKITNHRTRKSRGELRISFRVPPIK